MTTDKVQYKDYVCDHKAWRKGFREGFFPGLSTRALRALEDALANNDERLIQGATTQPPPLACVSDWPVEMACGIGLCGWLGEGLKTVGEVEEYFARQCYECDTRLGEASGCRHALNWFDDTPRSEAFPLLLEEVRKELKERQAQSEHA
jgi:hypothetical protein